MRWSNLFVIFRREVRDQIRDRRTLFMIFVLPILLYPILGIGVDPVCDGARAEAAHGRRRRGRVPAAGAPLLNPARRRLQSGAFRLARRGRAAGRAPGASRVAPGATLTCASRRSATARPRR